VVDGVVDAVEDAGIDLFVEGGGWIAGDVGGGGDDWFAETFDEVFAEGVVDEADGDGTVGVDEVVGEADGAFVDDGGGFGCCLEIVEDAEVGLAGIF